MEVTYQQSPKNQLFENVFASKKKLTEMDFGNVLKSINRTNLEGLDIVGRMSIFLRRRTQKLCRGTYQRPAILDKDLYCYWVHHGNPFLKLGKIVLCT